MHGVLGARVLGFGVLWDSSFILLPCASSSFLEYSRVVSIRPVHIHARGIGGASFGVSSFVGFEFHLITMLFFELSRVFPSCLDKSGGPRGAGEELWGSETA